MTWLKRLFGMRDTTEVEFVDEQGRVQKRQVGRALLDTAIASGAATSVRACICHIVSSVGGERAESWEVGKQLTQEQYDRFSSAGDVYALEHLEEGRPKTNLVQKAFFEQAKAVLASSGPPRPSSLRNFSE